jgi:error-prone DNA polymerase
MAHGTSGDPFVHLHVASGYSLRYGASAPQVLVGRAGEHGQDTLALTDRDGVYGAVKFALACRAAGVRPIFGVDLAVEPSGLLAQRTRRTSPTPARRTPARGGVSVDPRHPRVTLLAQNGRGWAALCRLVSATHLRGERGRPVTTLELIEEHVTNGGLFVLLGPQSELAQALGVRRPDLARAVLDRWRAAVPTGDLLAEIVSHRGPDDSARAARLLAFATEQRVGAVLSNAVRYADASDAVTADVLDAARRLVALDVRHVDRVNAEGHLKSGKEMQLVGEEIARLAGIGDDVAVARQLLVATRKVADQCAVDPRADLGIGGVHLPELEVVDRSGRAADVVLRERCETGLGRRGLAPSREVLRRPRRRARGRAPASATPRTSSPSPTSSTSCARWGCASQRAAPERQPLSTTCSASRCRSDPATAAHGAVPSPRCGASSPTSTSTSSPHAAPRSTSRSSRATAVSACTCVSMMDTYRCATPFVTSARPRTSASRGRRARQGRFRTSVPATPASRCATCPSCAPAGCAGAERRPHRPAAAPGRAPRRPAAARRAAPVRRAAVGPHAAGPHPGRVQLAGLPDEPVRQGRRRGARAAQARRARHPDAVGDAARRRGGRPGRRPAVDLDGRPRDDPRTFELVQSTRTLGCFQIESPGQRELVGKFAPETFEDLIIDISLFRPGPVKSDMVTPFLKARQGWSTPQFLHDDLRFALEETCGVVVFHEQVLQIVATFTGCSLAEADEARRGLGDREGQPEVEAWFRPRAAVRGYDRATVDRVWEVLKAFASFGFCKAHAAAFALPTYQSAWLKAHHPAAFLAGVLTHDPGMYPKRLILDDARQFGIAVLSLDVNRSDACYRVERVSPYDEPPPEILGEPPRRAPEPGLPDARAYGIRLGLADVKGISEAEIARIVAGRPYGSLADFWHRTATSRPIVERLVVAGAFDALYGIGGVATGDARTPIRRRGRVTRRDLLLQVGELDHWTRAARGPARRRRTQPHGDATSASAPAAVHVQAARQSQAPLRVPAVDEIPVQLALDLGDAPDVPVPSGLPEMTGAERVRAELEVLGLDASRHVVDFYVPFLDAIGATRSTGLLGQRTGAEVLVAGVKVATQTPPVRSGRRVVFVTLDDATGPVDATFFEDAQVGYATTLFHSWLLVIRGHTRRTGPRGISLRATGCWELPVLFAAWEAGGLDAVAAAMAAPAVITEQAVAGAAASRSTRPVMTRPPAGAGQTTYEPRDDSAGSGAGGMTTKRVLVHPSGFRQSPYADIKPAGGESKSAPRKLWHSSPGSSGG